MHVQPCIGSRSLDLNQSLKGCMVITHLQLCNIFEYCLSLSHHYHDQKQKNIDDAGVIEDIYEL